MKKFLLIALTVLLGMPCMAQSDGSTQLRAIEFDWEHGNVQEGGSSPLWYRVDLAPLYDDVESPTLALYLTNLSTVDATVTIKATLFGNTEERTYTIAPKENKIWSMGAAVLVQTNTQEVLLTLASDQKVALSANVYETEDVDDACVSSTLFVVEEGASTTQGAGTSVWYNIDLTDAIVESGGLQSNEVDVIITNNGSATATVQGALSMDCPSSGVTEYTMSIPAGGSATRTLQHAMIDVLNSNNVYLRVNTDQPLTITSKKGAAASLTPVFDGSTAFEAELDTKYEVSGEQVYKIRLDSLRGKRVMPEVTVTNIGATAATVTAQIGMTPDPKSVIEKTVTIAAHESLVKAIEKNMIDGISTQDGYVYVRIRTTQPISFSARLKHVKEGNACKNSRDFDWEKGHTQDANTTVWYAVDIAEAKANVQDIVLTVQNLASANATLKAEVAFACPYIDLQNATRTLAAGATQTQTLSYSSFGMLTNDVIYVGLTTNQKVKFSAETEDVVLTTPDDACLDAVVFDMTEGGKQVAGDTVWYKVGMNSLRMIDQLPFVSIQNRGTAAVTIHAALSLDCPDSIPNSERSLTIGVGGTYEKLISRDLLDNIDPAYDTVYVRLTANQAFAFQVQLKEENPGANCKSAIRFNWTSGNDQDADTDLWYLVDLTAAKASKKDIQLSIINKENAAASVSASFAFNCPCEVPQTESTTLAALAYKTTTLPYSSLETAGDTVWVRLTTNRTIHFEAALVDPAPFDTIRCDALTLKPFAWNTLDTVSADTAWYILTGSVLEQLKNAGDSTARLYLHNIAGTTNTITAHVAYHCPITSTMMSKQIKLGNDQEVYKLLERSFSEQIADKDTILVRLAATGTYAFMAELVNPNTGDDCLHAQLINLPDTLIQEAGTTLWYKLDVAAVSNLRSKITFGVENLDGIAGSLSAGIYTSCDSAAMVERTTTLGGNKKKLSEFTSEMFRGLGSNYVYLQITSAQQIRVFGFLTPLDLLDPQIEACADAQPVAPNTDYTLNAGDTAWYVVNMQDLRANTKGDGTLTIKNLSSSDKLTAKAEVSWECPVRYQMTDITRSIALGGQYVQTLSRASIDATSDSLLYVRVIGNQDLSFRLDITYSKGETCEDAIEFDWVNGNIHTGSTKPLWYHLSLTEDKVPDGKDLRLYIDNLDALNATDAGASLYFECGGSLISTIEHTFSAGASKHSDIDRNLLVSAGWPDLYICYWSNKNTKIYVELVEHQERTETIEFSICSGTPWTNPVTKEIMQFYAPNDPSFPDSPAPLQWNDTVAVREGSFICDSIYTFIVTPLHLPWDFQLTADTLAKYDAVPVLKQGMEVFTDFSRMNILTYLAQNDSVLLITDSCKWLNVPTDTIAKGTDSISMELQLGDSCGNTVTYSYKFPVAPYEVDSVELPSAHCAGETFDTKSGKTHTLSESTIIRDTVTYSAVDTITLGTDSAFLGRNHDTIYIYQLTVHPVLTTTIDTTICEGDTITWDAEKIYATGTFTKTFEAVTGCDSIVTLKLQVNPKLYTSIKDTICEGETYTFGTMNLTVTGTYKDTLHSLVTGCDSIVTLELTVQAPTNDPVETKTIPAGTSYTWRNMVCSNSGTYLDTAFYTTGCDSVYYELRLTVADPIARDTTIEDTVCVNAEWQSRTQTIIITQDTIWDEQVLFKDAVNGDIDSTYHYNIHVFLTTTPAIDSDSILAVCGKAVDVTAADNFLTAAIENEPLYAPNAQVAWEQQENDQWQPLSTDAIAGDIQSVVLRYVITSDCGSNASEPITVNVEMPAPTNSAEMANLPAVSKFNHYLLMINLNAIQNDLGWTLSEEDVTWYQVAGEADPTHPEDTEKDIEVGKGFYYTTGEMLNGQYYALIAHHQTSASDCEQTAATTILVCTASAAAPALQPTMASPEQDIYVLNLNPLMQTEIRVYDVEGNLLNTYTSTEAEQFIIRAASQQGYYMVDVQTDEQRTTLRYIVK
ncbi:MAG: T9SS type A sorting domain-containing protein [Paludibacteraceae bacterium]